RWSSQDNDEASGARQTDQCAPRRDIAREHEVERRTVERELLASAFETIEPLIRLMDAVVDDPIREQHARLGRGASRHERQGYESAIQRVRARACRSKDDDVRKALLSAHQTYRSRKDDRAVSRSHESRFSTAPALEPIEDAGASYPSTVVVHSSTHA